MPYLHRFRVRLTATREAAYAEGSEPRLTLSGPTHRPRNHCVGTREQDEAAREHEDQEE
jgi:hypothetical protein